METVKTEVKIRGEMGPLQQTSMGSREALGNILKSYTAKKKKNESSKMKKFPNTYDIPNLNHNI